MKKIHKPLTSTTALLTLIITNPTNLKTPSVTPTDPDYLTRRSITLLVENEKQNTENHLIGKMK